MSIKEGLDKVGQMGCDGNQDNAINSEDIQTSVVADSREVYQHSHKKQKDSLEGSLGSSIICGWTWVLEDTSTQAISAYIRCKQWMCWRVRLVKTTVSFICDQLFGALIHLNFIILILICFWLIIPGENYVIYGCSSARTTPAVSLYRRLTLEQNIVAVITQDRVIDGNLKKQIKNQTSCTFRLFLLTYIFQYISNWSKVF